MQHSDRYLTLGDPRFGERVGKFARPSSRDGGWLRLQRGGCVPSRTGYEWRGGRNFHWFARLRLQKDPSDRSLGDRHFLRCHRCRGGNFPRSFSTCLPQTFEKRSRDAEVSSAYPIDQDKNTCIELESEIWLQLQEMGIYRGMSVYHRGVKVTKSKGFEPFNIVAKWKKTYHRQHSYFYLGLQGFSWLDSLADFASEVQLLLSFAPQSRRHYQRGLRAVSLLQSVF